MGNSEYPDSGTDSSKRWAGASMEGSTCLYDILWILRTGAPWAEVPNRYPSYQTCHRRFQRWVRSCVMKGVLEAPALNLKTRGTLDVREAFIDGSFAPAKKGAPGLERQGA